MLDEVASREQLARAQVPTSSVVVSSAEAHLPAVHALITHGTMPLCSFLTWYGRKCASVAQTLLEMLRNIWHVIDSACRQVETRQAALQKSSAGAELQALPAEFARLTQQASALRQVCGLAAQQLRTWTLVHACMLPIRSMAAACMLSCACSALLPWCESALCAQLPIEGTDGRRSCSSPEGQGSLCM